MGKRTLYHPVGLHVLRGALEYCEIKIGRLTQVWNDPSREAASYTAVITELPDDLKDAPTWLIAKRLRGCFAEDVSVFSVTSHYNAKKKTTLLTAKILVDIHKITPMEHIIEANHER